MKPPVPAIEGPTEAASCAKCQLCELPPDFKPQPFVFLVNHVSGPQRGPALSALLSKMVDPNSVYTLLNPRRSQGSYRSALSLCLTTFLSHLLPSNVVLIPPSR